MEVRENKPRFSSIFYRLAEEFKEKTLPEFGTISFVVVNGIIKHIDINEQIRIK